MIKDELAQRIIMMYHGKKYDPNDESNVETQTIENGEYSVSELLKITDFAKTSGDIRNAISGGSVRVDGETITDSKQIISIPGSGILLEMGKKKAKKIFIK